VWALADARREGFLDERAFGNAMSLIALAQAGGEVSPAGLAAAAGRGLRSAMDGCGEGGEGGAGASPSTASPARPEAPAAAAAAAAASKPPPPLPPAAISSVAEGLAELYLSRILPLESAFKFGSFFSAPLVRADFTAKPSVLLLGAYSTGKTSFIEFCLGRAYPGSHVAPEPSTDRFVIVSSGPEDRRTPGHTLAVQPDLPYTSLAAFGNGLLSKLEGVTVAGAPILESVSFVDSPGVLSGEKQRVDRSYSFVDVVGLLSSRADAVYLFFDPAKLDISDEMKATIAGLAGQEEKIRIVLNKAGSVSAQELMRVYGALMYSLGRVTRAPEVPRVYIGSFRASGDRGGAGAGMGAGMGAGAGAVTPSKQLQSGTTATPAPPGAFMAGSDLFAAEAGDLLADLASIPSRAMDRKIADLVKRVRAARIHALIIDHLRRKLPAVIGKAKATAKLLADLPGAFAEVAQAGVGGQRLPLGDFPDPARYRSILASFDLSAFPRLRERDARMFEAVLNEEIPALVRRFENPYGVAGR